MTMGFIPMRTPDYTKDSFLLLTVDFMPLLFILSYVAPVFRVIALVVAEKESKVREGMRMMGLNESAYWISWHIQYFVIHIIIALAAAGIANAWVFTYSEYILVFFLFFLYGLAIYAFALFICSFFYRARLASVIGCMVYFASYILGELIRRNEVNEAVRNFVSLFPPIAISLACQNIVKLDAGKIGMKFSTMSDVIDDYRLSASFAMLTADIFIYLILGLYLDNVVPNESGVRKSFFFFLSKSYWSGASESSKVTPDKKALYEQSPEGTGVKTYEQLSETMKAKEQTTECLKVKQLEKQYSNGTKAVQGITLTMFKGQIFALLGHNGAGKTTTISMLTGAEDATDGFAEIFGMPIFENMEKMRTMIGVCPQHDVLFEQLTPREHLEIFATFKGMTDNDKIREGIVTLLDELTLSSAENQQAMYLSGGEKRKLSIAIAFIGDSKIILLDEPTSGMDMSSRRTVWRTLKKNKTDRIVILTTHYMDEADYLGDRIAIMAKGKIMCLGSSFFLKNKLGEGFNIAIVKKENADSDAIIQLINKYVANYKVLSNVSQELVMQLPKESEKNFKALFQELDAKMAELNVESYGISVTTLEEVFLQVGHGEDEAEEEKKSGDKVINLQEKKEVIEKDKTSSQPELEGQKLQRKSSSTNEHRTGLMARKLDKKGSVADDYTIANEEMREQGDYNLFSIHMSAILMKRLLYIKRGVIQLISELFVPILLVLFGLSLTQITFYFDSKPRVLDISWYPLPQQLVLNSVVPSLNGATLNDLTSNFNTGMNASLFALSSPSNNIQSLKEMEAQIYAVKDQVNPTFYSSAYIQTLDKVNHNYEMILFANLYSQESSTVFSVVFGEAIIRMAVNKPNLKIKMHTTPLPLAYTAKDLEKRKNGNALGQSIVLAFALMPASIITYIVREREDQLKHQQVISGISLFSYWLANSLIDFLKSSVPCALSIGLIFAFDVDLPYSWAMIIAYMFSIVPFTYATSFFFMKEAVSQVGTLMLHVFFGQIMAPVTLVLRTFENTREVGIALQWVLRLVPSYCLCNGIRLVSSRDMLATLEGKAEPEPELEIKTMAGGDILFLCLDFVIYIIALVVVEARLVPLLMGYFCGKEVILNEAEMSPYDEVKQEELVLKNAQPIDYSLLAIGLKKDYKISSDTTITAVRSMSLGLKSGECFALLGTTGAGKSTAFKMMTLDQTPTLGNISIMGKELSANFTKVRQLIGYCPQTESLFPPLTTRENLIFYAMLKGILKDKQEFIVDNLIQVMDLQSYRDIEAGQLSGGNKRKLSVAIALLGNPPIMILDEPSTGVDPQAKRFMWKIISHVTKERGNSTCIFTTHSMEEAEALSTKMAIMLRGRFRCIGPAQKIKALYGNGYEIEIKVKTPTDQEILAFLINNRLTSRDSLTKKELFELFDVNKASFLSNEVSPKGFACDFHNDFLNGRKINAYVAADFILIEKDGAQVMEQLTEHFKEIKLLEHYSAYYKIRIEGEENLKQTNGEILSYITDLAKQYGRITEYAASKTTLEQIFNRFASEDQKAEAQESAIQMNIESRAVNNPPINSQ